MNAVEILERIGASLSSTTTVKSVFGEPIHAEGKTIVPVAKVAYGFGGGSGAGPESRGEGGGGGGGARAYPAGALEITATQTRFIPFIDLRWMACAFVAGALFGSLGRRRRR
jgi:uncharacterized spore protein YtfJ